MSGACKLGLHPHCQGRVEIMSGCATKDLLGDGGKLVTPAGDKVMGVQAYVNEVSP
jgi:hypothetical protein